jgi:SAM-dependent methyltransferase
MSRLEEATGGDARILMLTDYMESTEIADLTHACDCYVSLHRAEGTGLTMAHAMAAGKPVIATGWSGNTDFMDASNSLLVRFDLVELDRDVGPYKTGGIWAEPDVEHASALMRHVYDRPDEASALGAAARHIIADRFSLENVGRAAAARLEVIASRVPKRTPGRPWTHPEHAGNAPIMARIRTIVADNVLDDRPVIVISKGDPIVTDLGGPEAWHFPQSEDGTYAGYYPSDSVTAIAHLEQLHERGAGYLLVPASSSWWLRHYTGLLGHLDTHYDRVAEDAACVLYRLDPVSRSIDRPPSDAIVEHLRETLEATGAWVEDLAPRVASTQRELAVLPEVLSQALTIVSETLAQVESDVDGRLEAMERSQKHLASRVDSTTAALDRFALHVEQARRRDAEDRDGAITELSRQLHSLAAPSHAEDPSRSLGPSAEVDTSSTRTALHQPVVEIDSLTVGHQAPESIPVAKPVGANAPGMSLLALPRDRADAATTQHRLAARPFMSNDRFSTGNLDGAMGFSRSDNLEDQRQSHPTFADVFRGDPGLITERQRVYLPFFTPGELVVDLGCGRGEFLELLTSRGVQARGVERNGPLARSGRRRGLEISEGDALEWLGASDPATLDGVFSAQLVEHIEPSQLDELLVLTRRALRPGGICIAETVNPENFEALKTFHVDLTHHKPIFPQVLLHLFWEAGFECAWVFYPLGGGFTQRCYDSVGEYAVVARA